TDALASQPQLLADGLERQRLRVAVQSVAELEHLALAIRQLAQRAVHSALAEADLELLLDGRLIRGEQVAEGGATLRADGRVETRPPPSRMPHLVDLLDRQLRGPRDLFIGGMTLELREQLPLGSDHLALTLHDVHRDANRPGLVRDAPLHGLADPPRGVG